MEIIREIYNNKNKCDISVKNGYATLCDSVFISDFDFDSPYIIPVIKASTGERKKIFYPYDKNSRLIPELELKKDKRIYAYLKKIRKDFSNEAMKKIQISIGMPLVEVKR